MLLTVVEDVKTLTDKMLEKGATLTQSGHFYVQNKPQSRSQGNVMNTCSCNHNWTKWIKIQGVHNVSMRLMILKLDEHTAQA